MIPQFPTQPRGSNAVKKKGGVMKRILLVVLATLFAASCATGPSRERDLVNRALAGK